MPHVDEVVTEVESGVTRVEVAKETLTINETEAVKAKADNVTFIGTVLKVYESCVVVLPKKFYVTNWAISLFGHNYFSFTLYAFTIFISCLIILFSVNKHDNISVLLDRTGFAQVI